MCVVCFIGCILLRPDRARERPSRARNTSCSCAVPRRVSLIGEIGYCTLPLYRTALHVHRAHYGLLWSVEAPATSGTSRSLVLQALTAAKVTYHTIFFPPEKFNGCLFLFAFCASLPCPLWLWLELFYKTILVPSVDCERWGCRGGSWGF